LDEESDGLFALGGRQTTRSSFPDPGSNGKPPFQSLVVVVVVVETHQSRTVVPTFAVAAVVVVGVVVVVVGVVVEMSVASVENP
jgi:hypothetical protein